MNRLNIAYFGSPKFSSDFLEKLLTDKDLLRLIEVKLIVTQPDKPTGRKQILTATPVKNIAEKYDITVLEFGNLKIENSMKIENLKLIISKLDIALVYAYASIIPSQLLSAPKYGFWCIHPSLLPKYRGTSPMATALMNGDKTTGVTIINMDEKIDHGPIIIQDKYQILSTDKRSDLENKLTNLAFDMFKKTVFKLTGSRVNEFNNPQLVNSLTLKPQKHNLATYTKKLAKQDGFIEFENLKIKNLELNKNLKLKIYNLFRGLHPWPGLWTILPNGKRLKITEMKIENGKLKIVRVQLEGKKEIDFEIFNKAYKVF